MSKTWHQLFYHLIWATRGREPLITPDVENRLHRCIGSRGSAYGFDIRAVNGMEDHMHVVGSWPPKVSVAEAAQKLKGASSFFATSILLLDPFHWQQGYGAVTVSKSDLDRVIDYVLNQKAHHSRGTTLPELERTEQDVVHASESKCHSTVDE